ncbi:MAG TPA: CARDB domain-containing protein [Thermoplasmata archaeon]|nr:CARDB domain-containing protein [Thermoplasmata archaeon]
MSDRATRNGKALSLMIVSLLAVGGLLGVVTVLTPPVRADNCGQSSTLLTGNWVVTAPQTCSGMFFYLDGNLYIRNGGSLTLQNGGISFVEDTTHVHALAIDAGGSIILLNSTLTTSTNTLNPYVKLAATVNGTLAMRTGSMLKFPGTLNLNSGSVLNMSASTITGFSDSDLGGLGSPAWISDNDGSAIMTLAGSTAYLYKSTIEKIYENTQPGMSAKNLSLTAGSTLYVYDSYVGIDFSNNWQIHNVMTLDATSKAYLYNMTLDQAESDATPQYLRLPAMVPLTGGFVDIFRWMWGKATDPYGTPLVGATIWSHVGSSTATYPDNGNAQVPSSTTLAYIGRIAANFNTTGSNGVAQIPLWTDQITSASLPNANSFGNYETTGTYPGTYVGSAAASFVPYPSITAADNNLPVRVALPVPGLTPDLTIISVVISGGNGVSDSQPLNRPFTITATIHNTGANPVTNVPVVFFSTNVDANGDGVMDSPVSAYSAAGYEIANVSVASVPANGDAQAIAPPYTVQGSFEMGLTLSVVVNPPTGDPAGPSAIPETNLTNNIATHAVSLIAWPDLAIVSSTDVHFPVTPVANNNVPVDVTVHNLGTGPASGARLVIYEAGNLVSNQALFSLSAGQVANLEVQWHPTTVGNHTLTVYVMTANTSMRNTDYAVANNAVQVVQAVRSQPDLALIASEYSTLNVSQNRPFSILVHVHNFGQTPVDNTSVAVYLNGNYSLAYGRTDGVGVVTETNVTVAVSGIPIPGLQHLTVVVNPDHTLVEGGAGYANDYVNITMNVNAPQGTVILYSPVPGTPFGPTDLVSVAGVVRDTTAAQNGIPSLTVTIAIVRADGSVAQFVNATTDSNGLFTASIQLNDLPDGTYTLRVSSSQGTIAPANPSIVVKRNVPFLSTNVPLLGIPWWLFLIILAAVAAIVIGVTVYFKVYGLGKMVECGECGAFIPEDATVCPKCGVEFEKDMAKCSNCQAWIPVDVKQCPECGVEFATGEVEMADYQEKMRLQYDEVVQKFREDASRQLGRALSDKEFQEWWRKQPTFLTFEDWLREEEEMRKMGSKPCPVCGTLNSVTATVCHKCGSLMKEDKRPPAGGGPGTGGMAPPARPRAVVAPPPTSDQGPAGGSQAAGAQANAARPVIRKAVTPAPVVQKRIIKRPSTEGDQTGAQDQTSDQSSGDQTQGDEL